jgi:hypothetical protein
MVWCLEVEKPITQVRINPKKIPNLETNLLCVTFLDAIIRFYDNQSNETAFKKWLAEKGEDVYGSKNC